MAIEVVKPGLATSVQDAGRPGYYNIGIPLSGALDQYALRVANLLVGNEEGAAVLEASLLAPDWCFARPQSLPLLEPRSRQRSTGHGRATNRSPCRRAIGLRSTS